MYWCSSTVCKNALLSTRNAYKKVLYKFNTRQERLLRYSATELNFNTVHYYRTLISIQSLNFGYKYCSQRVQLNKLCVCQLSLTATAMQSGLDSGHYESDESDEEMDEILKDDEHEEFSRSVYNLIPGMGHHVLIILPKVKWGSKRNYKTTPELQLAEATALIETLPNWKVIQKIILPCENPDKKYIFGSGNLEKLKELASKIEITAVFISRNTLTGLQHYSLQECFRKPVYDRFTIVLQIFKEHSRSKEAKLQVALAEIPHLRIHLKNLQEKGSKRESRSMSYVGGSGESYLERKKNILFEREFKLKKMIESLIKKRQLIRRSRLQKSLPTVAVVGYTNSGKTTLIKALTRDEKLQPREQLFATLDVTAHKSLLSCQQAVIFLDTVGFITDIPTSLIGAFTATMEDIALADLIIHVWDASHPDIVWQRETVKRSLDSLSMPHRLKSSCLEVGNKMDLLECPFKNEGEFMISALHNIGLFDLQNEIEDRLMQNTGMLFLTVRVPNGGDHMRWLNSWTTIEKAEVDTQDSNFLILFVVCTNAIKNKFQKHFGLQMTNRR